MRPLIYALVIAGIAVVFAIKNSHNVDVWLFGFNQGEQYSLALIIIITLLMGALVGLLAATKSIWNKRNEVNKQKKQISALEKTVEELRKKVPVTVPPTSFPSTDNPQPPITPV